jgi:hypothetical protein
MFLAQGDTFVMQTLDELNGPLSERQKTHHPCISLQRNITLFQGGDYADSSLIAFRNGYIGICTPRLESNLTNVRIEVVGVNVGKTFIPTKS